MGKDIVYSKKYPEERYKIPEVDDLPHEPRLTYEQIMEEITRNLTFEELPDRKEESEKFVQSAIRLCELYEYDIEVEQLDASVLVKISFDAPTPIGKLNRLIGVADEVEIFPNIDARDITLTLKYYTHAVYRRGRQIYP